MPQGKPRGLRVLLIEDDPGDALLFEAKVSDGGGLLARPLDIVVAGTLDEASRRLADEDVELVLLDLHLPDAQGLEGLDTLVASHPAVPIVVLTGLADRTLGEEALAHGAQDYLVKGEDDGRVLHGRLAFALQRHALQQERAAAQQLLVERAEQLEEVNAQLQAINQLREQLIEVVSHELRTPLTPILGFAEMLGRDPEVSPTGCLMIRAIQRNAKRLLRRVDELLTVGRARRNPLPTERCCISVRDVVDRVLADLDELATEVTVTGAVDATVLVDPGHLEQILENLLRNSSKYGRPPFTIDVQLDGERASITVEDHGEGIPPEFVPTMWEPFAQSRHRGSAPATGVGLGLAVVHLLAAANDIAIGYETVPTGARFRLAVPLSSAAAPAAAPGAASCHDATSVCQTGAGERAVPEPVAGGRAAAIG